MTKPTALLILTTAIALVIGCKVGQSIPADGGPRSPLDELIVQDVTPITSDHPSLSDLAFTFPVFEMGAAATKENIARGDSQVVAGQAFWKLEGDGAQPSVSIERLTPEKVDPCQVRLSYGPVFDGPTYVYVFERIEGGWKRLSYKITEQGSSTNNR
ncbi:MAG: hypothetical protein V4689_08715 [Verrucomicrobiota bacterium]